MTIKEILGESDFSKLMQLHKEKKFGVIKGASKRFSSLMNWQKVSLLLSDRGSIQSPVQVQALGKDPYDFDFKNPSRLLWAGMSYDYIHQALQDKCSMAIRGLDRYSQQLAQVCDELEGLFGGYSGAEVFLNHEGEVGYPPHAENTDLVVLQLEGERVWKTYGTLQQRLEKIPQLNTGHPNGYAIEMSLIEKMGYLLGAKEPEEFNLSSGDVLFQPAGVFHGGNESPTNSLHLSLFNYQISQWDLFDFLRTEFENNGVPAFMWDRVDWKENFNAGYEGLLANLNNHMDTKQMEENFKSFVKQKYVVDRSRIDLETLFAASD